MELILPILTTINLCRHLCSERVIMRDAKSYCAILLDDNNRKPIIRFYYLRTKKSIAIINDKHEIKYDIENISDLYKYRKEIIDSVQQYQ